ncbi:MFS general substrate transporter [Mycena floridula]|nr:MFS general substrate transporter [Mycena floridula]
MSDETSPLLSSFSGPNNVPASTRNTDMSDETSPLLSGFNGPNNVPASNAEEQPVEAGSRVKLISVMIPLVIGIFLAAMDQTIVISSYAAIGSELHELHKTSWVVTAYMISLTSFQPLYGKLSDIFGRKACLLTAYFIFTLGSLLCGLSKTMDQLICARALAGIGGGGMSTVVSIIFSDIVPLRSRGTWQGIMNIVFASGSMAGAPLGGLLADRYTWRWAFLIQVPLAMLAITSVSFALHLPHESTTDFKAKVKRIDFGGAVTLVSAILFLLYGLERGGNKSWGDKLTMMSLSAFVVTSVIFGVIEMKIATEPFAPQRIVASRSMIASYLVNFFGIAAALSTVFHLSLYLQAVQHQSASQTGLWMLPSILAGVSGSLIAGLTMQSTGKFYWLTVVAYSMQFVGLFVTTLMTGIVWYSVPGIICAWVVAAMGNGIGITSSLISLIANAGPEDQAIATAVSYLFRSLGSVAGISVGSMLVQSTLRSSLREKLYGHQIGDIDELVRRVRESLDYIKDLDPVTRGIVEASYEESIHLALWLSVGLAGCAVISSLFIKEKPLPARK